MSDMHNKPIAERVDWLFELAHRYGETFRSPEAWLARRHYLAKHPTAIVVLKCMDGRINIPFATNTPTGILMPFRNLGGIFDLGWPHMGEVLAHHVLRMTNSGRRVLILITYHWSKGDPERDCAGFHYNTESAIAHTYEIRRQVEYIFGGDHRTVYPLVCGFETDEDALVIHGNNGTNLNLATVAAADAVTLEPQLTAILPDMPVQMRADLLPLLYGNLEHIAVVREQLRRQERQLSVEHHEWMICLGRGFDFLHTPNLALIIGPYSPDLADPLRKAAAIIENNMKAGRIPDDGFLLLAAAPYDEIGVDRARAELKSRFLASFASKVLREEFSNLAAKMTKRAAVLDWNTRTIEQLVVE
ncbi:MAG: hypothetical protein HQL90_00570 [Magnetococcales bacterium]|nr:hypothetical protein [Magnetococcales bacterium]